MLSWQFNPTGCNINAMSASLTFRSGNNYWVAIRSVWAKFRRSGSSLKCACNAISTWYKRRAHTKTLARSIDAFQLASAGKKQSVGTKWTWQRLRSSLPYFLLPCKCSFALWSCQHSSSCWSSQEQWRGISMLGDKVVPSVATTPLIITTKTCAAQQSRSHCDAKAKVAHVSAESNSTPFATFNWRDCRKSSGKWCAEETRASRLMDIFDWHTMCRIWCCA